MLRIWSGDPYNGQAISQDGTFIVPIEFKVPPTGGVRELLLWLRHDELSGELVQSSYDVSIYGADYFGSESADWIEVAPDEGFTPGTYASSLNVGDVLGGAVIPFWVRLTVPNTPETGVREDIYIAVDTSSSTQFHNVNLSTGTFYNCAYNPNTHAIEFNTSNDWGEWISEWIDVSSYSNMNYVKTMFEGTVIRAFFRTSPNASQETATAWMPTIEDISPDDYLQVRILFQRNATVGTTGLVRRIFSNLDFSVFRSISVGGFIPHTNTPGDGFAAPKSVRWSGFFNATVSGVYSFRTVSNDGHRLRINESLVSESWITTAGNATTTSTGLIFLEAGWHYIEWEYYHSSGTNTINSFVTVPGFAERAIVLSDFSPVERMLRVKEVGIRYSGQKEHKFDLRIYDGPDVPELIAPPEGDRTELFAPDLTVYQRNCEYVEFQMDMERHFASSYLETWIEPCSPETFVTSNAPTGSRPPGIWYWRARGILNGVYSAWSDWTFLEILPLQTNDEYLYLNVNVGLEVHDPIIDERHVYVNANVGVEQIDPIEFDRHQYMNVNIDKGIGEVIYPLYDRTLGRKFDFDGDEEFEVQD